MLNSYRRYLSMHFVAVAISLASTLPAHAVNRIFLSNDTAETAATYVVEFNPTVAGALDKTRLTFPTSSNPGGAALGRVHLAGKVFEDAVVSVDPVDPTGLTLIVDLKKPAKIAIGATVRIELFNIRNPVEGNYDIDISTFTAQDQPIETLTPVPFTVFAVGDIGASNTAAGRDALSSNTSGHSNTAAGARALRANTSGQLNTATGVNALTSNTTANRNAAVGYQALRLTTEGSSNTAVGAHALENNTTGITNSAIGESAMFKNIGGLQNAALGRQSLHENTTGNSNTAVGMGALATNTTGSNNTAIGAFASVSSGALNNATAIGAGAGVNASNKIRLGNTSVTVIEGQVPFTTVSDKTKKENFLPVDGEGVLRKLREFTLTSWNFIGHDPKEFRHYGPMAQDFFAAFGNDGVGTIGTPTTINSGDLAGILMIAVQALETRTAEVADLKARLETVEQLVKEQPNRVALTSSWD